MKNLINNTHVSAEILWDKAHQENGLKVYSLLLFKGD
jgi:hypothetical protein